MQPKSGFIIHIAGLVIFIFSWFVPSVANEMTNSSGDAVKAWVPAYSTHIRLALEPLFQFVNYSTAVDKGDNGDGYEQYVANSLYRAVYALPVSIGWFAIVILSPVVLTMKICNQVLWWLVVTAGCSLLISSVLLTFDFKAEATIYVGRFHLGLGAYAIVFAYILIGLAFLIRLPVLNHKDNKQMRSS